MRSVPAVALSIALAACAAGGSWAASAPVPTAPTPASTAAPSPAANASTADNEAAARHAKRTACINQARAKKLVGAQKNAYIKDCVGTA